MIFFSSEHTQCYTLAFYSWKRKKSRTSREHRLRLAGTHLRVWTGEGNFLKVQTPGLTWGSRRGQDTCAAVESYLPFAITGVHTQHLFVSEFTGASDTLSGRRAQVQSGWEEEARQNVDFNFCTVSSCTNFQYIYNNKQRFIRCDIYSYYN